MHKLHRIHLCQARDITEKYVYQLAAFPTISIVNIEENNSFQ